MWAASENHPKVIEALVAAGANVNARTEARQGVNVAGYRKAEAESVGFTPILFAAREGGRESIDALLAGGASINDASASGTTVLQTAMATGHWELVRYLLDRGADPNADTAGYAALHWAAGRWEGLLSGIVGAERYNWLAAKGPGKLELVKSLLAHGANPNQRLKKMPPTYGGFSSTLQFVGATPFVLSGLAADVDVMRALVAAGADPKLTSDNGTTALMTAAGLGQSLGVSSITSAEALEAVKFALAQGIDINAANTEGETALHGAAYFGVDAVAQFLVEQGATINARNRLGLTPTTVAQGYGGGGGILINGSTAALLHKLGGTGDVDMAPTSVETIRSPCPQLVVDFALQNPGYGKVYVTTTAETHFVGGTCSDIGQGTSLRIKGVRETNADKSWDGSVVASAIEIMK
jgi:ankyrin repeat protein